MSRLDRYDWAAIQSSLDREGQATLPRLLSATECAELLRFNAADRGAMGPGNLWALVTGERGFKLPPRLSSFENLRADLYSRLVPIANRWISAMGVQAYGNARRYPEHLKDLQKLCRQAGQNTAQSAVGRLAEGQYQPLDQKADGACVFPLQATILLSQPGKDFAGGQFIMTEQRPRMQTRPMVVPLARGDAAVFAVSHRPVKGSKGTYRVNLRYAVSRVKSGNRTALNVVFHHAP